MFASWCSLERLEDSSLLVIPPIIRARLRCATRILELHTLRRLAYSGNSLTFTVFFAEISASSGNGHVRTWQFIDQDSSLPRTTYVNKAHPEHYYPGKVSTHGKSSLSWKVSWELYPQSILEIRNTLARVGTRNRGGLKNNRVLYPTQQQLTDEARLVSLVII